MFWIWPVLAISIRPRRSEIPPLRAKKPPVPTIVPLLVSRVTPSITPRASRSWIAVADPLEIVPLLVMVDPTPPVRSMADVSKPWAPVTTITPALVTVTGALPRMEGANCPRICPPASTVTLDPAPRNSTPGAIDGPPRLPKIRPPLATRMALSGPRRTPPPDSAGGAALVPMLPQMMILLPPAPSIA